MTCSHLLAAAALLLSPAPPLPAQTPPTQTLNTSTSLVLVPTLVRSPTGALLPNLHATDFRITDNGRPQRVLLDEAAPQPLSLVILLQTGAAAHDLLPAYAGLAPLIDAITASAPGSHTVVIPFDSRPEELWTLPPSTPASPADLTDALAHLTPGDDGAAILDALAQALDLLDQQPRSDRRLILLISQQADAGSSTPAGTILRRLAESNTTLEAVNFSPEKAWLHDQFTKPRHGQPPYQMSPLGPTVIGTFDLGTPLVVLRSLRKNGAASLATLSGGESLPFTNRSSLEQQLLQLSNHIPNRYLLSFSPASPAPGLHTLAVTLPGQPGPPSISARAGYWASPPPPPSSPPTSP